MVALHSVGPVVVSPRGGYEQERFGLILRQLLDITQLPFDRTWTFGVRKKRKVLTDPDTGLPLESPGAPIGVIRVSEVHEKTSFAQVIETAGPVERGDELEWIGVYELVTPQQPGATQQ